MPHASLPLYLSLPHSSVAGMPHVSRSRRSLRILTSRRDYTAHSLTGEGVSLHREGGAPRDVAFKGRDARDPSESATGRGESAPSTLGPPPAPASNRRRPLHRSHDGHVTR